MSVFVEFDLFVTRALNGFSRDSFLFDRIVYEVSRTDLLKGGVLLALLWWCWTRRNGQLISQDLLAIRTVAGALLAILVGRALQNFLPMRLRPGHEPSLDFVLPHGVSMTGLDGWSSFPSDHAVLFFALSAAAWASSRVIGLVAFLWTAVVICLPRIYLGLHYASDILAGAAVGIAVMAFALRLPLPPSVYRWLSGLQATHPGILYALAFLGTYQMATLFANSRLLVEGLTLVLRHS